MKSPSALAILILSIFAFLLSFNAFAQCTDSDNDGYYYEEGCGTDRDCNDADPDIYPGASEICNGYDDDCDSSLDEACDTSCDDSEKSGSDIRVTYENHGSYYPSLAWNGSGYGVAWRDIRDGVGGIYFVKLDSSGSKIGSDILVNDSSSLYPNEPSLAYAGSKYGVSWFEQRDGDYEIYFGILDSSGNKTGSDTRISHAEEYSWYPSLVWNGNHFGVSWYDFRDSNYEIYFAQIDAEGNLIGSEIRITYDSSASERPSLVWNGEGYGISWDDDRYWNSEIYFVRLDPSGNKIGSDIRVTYDPASSLSSSLVWTGNEYAISWYDSQNKIYVNEIFFVKLDSAGNKIGEEARITFDGASSSVPSLTWTGSEYGVSWDDRRDENIEIYFTRLTSNGNKIISDIRITYAPEESSSSSLLWNGTDYALSWYDYRLGGGNREIYFARINCCGNALDALITGLIFDNDKQTMNWNSEAISDRYDVMKGDLMNLRSTGGDFTSSLSECLEDNSVDAQSFDSEEPTFPGDGFYYIVRAQADCRNGTCNCGYANQVGDRDSEIQDSINKCP